MGPVILGKGPVNSMYEHDVKKIEVANRLIAQCKKQKPLSPVESYPALPAVTKLYCPKPVRAHQSLNIFNFANQTHELELKDEKVQEKQTVSGFVPNLMTFRGY
ncbi:MAG: hypothetical protein NTZ86_06570 [Legionellales bacterium]|nr:hypothetical protein [Legionellales bacterium]